MAHTLAATRCPLCGSIAEEDFAILYPARIPQDSFTKKVFSARRLPDRIHYQIGQCRNDGLVRSNPVLSDAELQQLYKGSLQSYDSEIKHLTETYLNALEPTLAKKGKKASILEIGCGSGFLLSALYEDGYKNIMGIEPSVEAVKKAQPSVASKIITSSFSPSVTKNRTFDIIYLFQTLDHLHDVSTFLEDCYSLLNPGGIILSYHHDIDFFVRKLLGEHHPIIDIEHIHLFSKRTTAALFEKHGFLIVQLESPKNKVSFSHLVWLLPVPALIKQGLVAFFKRFPALNGTVSIYLGNILVSAQKPQAI